ncbi:MAG: GNAT family N-acetyltransferase [Chitinophagaceae bacterium]|nr:GNAT family N-acetyltransferase [Chitinophagaceae bacterium]
MIKTQHLRLKLFSISYADEMFKGREYFEKALGVTVPENWTNEKDALEIFYNEMKKDSSNAHWWAYLIIHTKDNKLIGCCGYKGQPKDGTVEIGYEIHPEYRSRGYAVEAAKGLIENAFTFPEVSKVLAHTLAEKNASGSVLKKNGFTYVKQLTDPEDGELWQWEFERPGIKKPC